VRTRRESDDTLVMLLGGGQGERLYPLTRDRAKPAVPFGGIYRVIDFTLSNCLNSGLRQIYVLTQYKSSSLERHLRLCWNCFHEDFGEFVVPIPPQQRMGERWYLGTADAIVQNIYTLEQHKPANTLILGGDHIYKMDYSKMIDFHQEKGADVTVGGAIFPVTQSRELGIIGVDDDMRITDFEEKPESPKHFPGQPDMCLASMGIYLFNTPTLVQLVSDDAKRDSTHDFGRDILPRIVNKQRVFAYPFSDDAAHGSNYWRDIGTIDAYWQANMDLLDVNPRFDLYDPDWPIRTHYQQYPPARMIPCDENVTMGIARNAIIAHGCVIMGGRVERSVLSPGVHVDARSEVVESILMEGVRIGKRCQIQKTIVDKNVVIPDDTMIGLDAAADRRRFTITSGGVVVVPKDVPESGEFWKS